MTAAFWGELLIVTALVAGVPGAYALRRGATIAGLVTLAAVTFTLFLLWFFLSLGYVVQLLGGWGSVRSLWPVIFVLVGIAAADVVASWLGWRWHRRLHPPGSGGEGSPPADGGSLPR